MTVYFTQLVTYRCAIKEVRYGLGDQPVDKVFKLPPCDPADPNSVPDGATLYMKVPTEDGLDAGAAYLCRWHDVAGAELQRAEIAGDSRFLGSLVELPSARIMLIWLLSQQQTKGGDPVSHCLPPRSPAHMTWMLAFYEGSVG
jgi:hypothetical protein